MKIRGKLTLQLMQTKHVLKLPFCRKRSIVFTPSETRLAINRLLEIKLCRIIRVHIPAVRRKENLSKTHSQLTDTSITYSTLSHPDIPNGRIDQHQITKTFTSTHSLRTNTFTSSASRKSLLRRPLPGPEVNRKHRKHLRMSDDVIHRLLLCWQRV